MESHFSVSSYFNFYFCNTNHFSLSKKERCQSKALTIALSVLTAGLAILLTYVFCYSRNYWQYRSISLSNSMNPKIKTALTQSGILPTPLSNLSTNNANVLAANSSPAQTTTPQTTPPQMATTLPLPPPVTVAIVPKVALPTPGMHFLFDPLLVKNCQHQSLEDAIYEHNKELIEGVSDISDFMKKHTNSIEGRYYYLRGTNRQDYDTIIKQHPNLTLGDFLEEKFNQLKIALKQGRQEFEVCCNDDSPYMPCGISTNFPWAGIFLIAPRTSPVFDQPLKHFRLSKIVGLRPLGDALPLECGESRFFYYVETYIKKLIEVLSLKERYKHPEVKAALENMPLRTILQPIEETVLRSSIILNNELADLKLNQFDAASPNDFDALVKRFCNFNCPPDLFPLTTEIEKINGDNFTTARVIALRYITDKNQILDILPKMDPKFSFLFNFSKLDTSDLVTHFDKIFALFDEGYENSQIACKRMESLTTDQIYALADKFAVSDLHNFTVDQVNKLDLSKFTPTQRQSLEMVLL